MARSYRLTCLKTMGNNLLKLELPCLTFEPFLPMIQCSDRPKTYWGYYQDYLVSISEKKLPQKMSLIFVKIRWPAIWTEKLGKTGVAGDVQIVT